MLKRQRASSPFPQSPSLPQDITSEGVIDIRDLKRRRVAPPSLDGQTRGRSTHPLNSDPMVDEYEEEYIEEECNGGSEAQLPQSEENAEYAEVNSVLKEMHMTLHKHRQMFLPVVPLLPGTPQSNSPHPELIKTPLSYRSEHQTPTEESARVYEHYEGANRSLASAFLSRRQHHAGQP